MAQSKNEKRNAAKKVAEAKSQVKKTERSTNAKTETSGKAVKGKKPLGTAKKK